MGSRKRRFGRVRKLPSGRYQARYRGPDGLDHPAPTTFRSERDADRFLSLVEADITSGRWLNPDAGRTSVAEWTEQWFASASSGWKAKTRHTYRSVLDRLVLPQLGRVQLAVLRPIAVNRWVADLSERWSPSQVRQAYRLLAQIMTAAVDNSMIPASPCRKVRLPRLPEADPRILTVEQVDQIAGNCVLGDRVLVLLLAYAGLRIGEALPLRRRHVQVAESRIVVADAVSELPGGPVIDTPKNHQRRELAVPAFVVRLLKQHLATLPDDPDTFVFPGRQRQTSDRQQSYHGFRRRFLRAVTAAGLEDVTPHDLRATHASWVADSHGVLVAARRLGHANASVTTRHYARAIDQRDDEVARHLDKVNRTRSGTQRARKPRKAEK
ncbi:tyrosine-type recombinase/integrase [Micromonospora sp. WMMD1102]|uniref:tyrosine-type recombinase/integrase n=1 Tax=Micromonospora sp. WMMD1102 TaxID=3016105 RepID=UPI002415030A|nr:site-specific integrase [Micromonospora sp. WMMD1102]MDG4790251.1 tyrosine-type recombinase/integrase [Micromonospora sp. WMMD1102]